MSRSPQVVPHPNALALFERIEKVYLPLPNLPTWCSCTSRTATALIRDLISDNLLRLLHFGLGVVAVVPIFAATISFATGNRLALGTLEALQTVRALRVRVALASAALQILGTAAVSAAQPM